MQIKIRQELHFSCAHFCELLVSLQKPSNWQLIKNRKSSSSGSRERTIAGDISIAQLLHSRRQLCSYQSIILTEEPQ